MSSYKNNIGWFSLVLLVVFFNLFFVSPVLAGDLEVCQDAGYTEVGNCNSGYCISSSGNNVECAGCIANPKTHVCCLKPQDPNNPNPIQTMVTACIDYTIGNTFYGTTSTPSDTVKEPEPITFTPQVTIPGSVQFGGKVFTINKGQGIEVNGELLSKYIALLFNWLIGAIGVIVVAYMAFGGMQWLAAAGSAEGINKAKETIRDSFIGLLLVVSSYTVLYYINPNLVGFDPLKINEVEGITLIGSDAYQKITGTRPVKAFSEEMKNAMRQVSQANNVHYCVLATIFTKESSGRVDALGHDENVRKDGIKSRRDFVNNGCLMYSGKKSTAVCSITGAAVNDDAVNTGKADLGLDWRFSHGIGLGQITIFPDGPACNGASHCRQIGNKLYDPKSLFKLDINLDAVVGLWKNICPGNVTQDCFRKYNGSGEAAEQYGREAWGIYNNCLTENP